MNTRKMRYTKGITLVALVVTIIVMLILAGVALSLVVGDDGVIGRAIKTRNTHGVAVAKEQIALKAADYGGEYYIRI